MDYEKLIAKARKTNTERDEGDRRSGFAAPGDIGPFDLLRTAFMAIECGIKIDDWNAVAEAQAMLEKIIEKYEPIKVILPGREKKNDTAFCQITRERNNKDNSMPTLFEIGADAMALHDLLTECGGELPDAEAEAAIDAWLTEANIALEAKVDSYCALIREFEARSEAREIEAKRLMALAGADGNQAKRLKDRLKAFFEIYGLTKLETPRFRVSIQANGGALPLVVPQVWEGEPAAAPEAFQRRIVQLDREAIREAIRNDEETHGAYLGGRATHLRIR